MRDIYEAHTVGSGYGDIGYQLAIGPEGYVYEGRWSGGTHFPIYDIEPSNGTPLVVRGAHTMGYNIGNAGIVLLGDYSEETPSDAAWWALTVVVAMLTGNAGVNPRRHRMPGPGHPQRTPLAT